MADERNDPLAHTALQPAAVLITEWQKALQPSVALMAEWQKAFQPSAAQMNDWQKRKALSGVRSVPN
jgi:2-polyprenyl-6-methoxyphenol hydroxylase-like FAD-dependent oxidoreductase